MDETDLAILREMFFDRVWRFGGLDPRVSSAEIARRLHLSHTTVSDRTRDWSEGGFLDGYVVFPNPDLFGLRLMGQILVSPSPRAASAVLAVAPRTRGLAYALELRDGDLLLLYLGSDQTIAERGGAMLSRVPRVRMDNAYHPWPMPPSVGRVGELDWRIIRALRASPMAPLGTIARKLAISPRLLRRRFDRLLDHHVLFYLPRLDPSKTSGALAVFNVYLTEDADPSAVWKLIHDLNKVYLPLTPWGAENLVWELLPSRPDLNHFLLFFLVLESPARVTDMVRRIEGFPGVRSAHAEFWTRWWDFPRAYDLAIAELTESASAR